ncbi:MAG: hypothetical protein ACI92Z_001222 [Paracoccaceae bacterium]|jgi:hypothetical protein
MSDPVTKIEIEDVLSSIRRLVSEETGSQPRPDPVRNPSNDSRLVLTPALRVSDVTEDAPKAAVTELAQDDTPWNNPETTLFTAAQFDSKADDDSENDWGEAAKGLADVYVMAEGVRHDDVKIEIEADPIPEAELEWADDGSDEAGREHEDEPSRSAELDNLSPLSAKIQALETAIGDTQDQWEPDGMAGDDYAGTSSVKTLQWQDHAEDAAGASVEVGADIHTQAAAAAAEPTSEPDSDATDAGANDLDFLVSDDGLMDEESLRELVADIVREELQGALGERITRNVRKLVRREIHRALTTQQLD